MVGGCYWAVGVGSVAGDDDVGDVFKRGDVVYLGRMTKDRVKAVLDRVLTWPESDQAELAEYVEQIESRHRSEYEPTAEELRAIDDADRSGVATEEEVGAAFRAFRSA